MGRLLTLVGSGSQSRPRYQIVTTRNGVANNRRQGTANARNDIRLESRRKMYLGKEAVSGLKVAVGNYRLNAGVGEENIGNGIEVEAALEIISPSGYTPFVFNGSQKPTIAQGVSFITSDLIAASIAGGGTFWLRQSCIIQSASEFLLTGGGNGASTGEFGKLSPSTSSQVFGTGALTTPTGGTDFGTGLAMQMILGIPANPMVSVCILGDSIANGNNDNVDAFGCIGFIQRGLQSVDGYPVPWIQQSIGGFTFNKATTALSPKLRKNWPYVTHMLVELVTNDISNGTTLSQMQAYATAVWAEAKAVKGPYGKPLHVTQTLCMPRVTSTDSYATAANQTPVAGFTVGGVRDQFNEWVVSQVGQGSLDAVIDPNPYVEDQSNHGKWVTTGAANYATNDGIHPSTAAHILAAPAVTAWAQTLTA